MKKHNFIMLTDEEAEETKRVIGYLRSENQQLSEYFSTSISTIVEMLPKEVSDILRKYRFVSNEDDYFEWERMVKDELVELVYQTVKNINFQDNPVKAFCPLCEGGLLKKPKNLAEGRTLEGIERHLEGIGKHRKCKIFELIQKHIVMKLKKNK